jgi:hypothetical protein
MGKPEFVKVIRSSGWWELWVLEEEGVQNKKGRSHLKGFLFIFVGVSVLKFMRARRKIELSESHRVD